MTRTFPEFTKPVRTAFLLWAALAGMLLPGYAATNGLMRYGVRIWQTDDGLPQNSVHALAQTADGYLWVGTHEGLARFDGLRFTILDETNAAHLKSGWITALQTARDGSLWIGCEGAGVTRLKSGVFTHFSETNGLPSNQIRSLYESRDGSIWIGSEGGLTHYKDGQLRSYSEKNALPDNSIRAICEDSSGTIRVATRRGLCSLEPDGSISTVNFGLGATANALKSVCEDRQKNIWVTSNEGVTSSGKHGRKFFGVPEGLPDKIPTVVYEDRAGRIWIGTYDGVACVVNGAVVSTPMNEAGFGDLVYAIYEDREENLWVGGRDGLYCLRPARFETFTTQEGLTCNNVMSVCEDSNGDIWLATWGGGVNRLSGDRVVAFGVTNGLSYDLALALHESRDGSLWVGMDFSGGLNRLVKNQNVGDRWEGLIAAPIRMIHEDRQGVVWVGTSRGLNMMRKGRFTAYTTAKGLAGNNVMAVCEDSKGVLWFGTDGGLSRWDQNKFTNFTTRDGLSDNHINSVFEDSTQTLWIGTKSGGLNRFCDGKFTAYTTKDGLFSDEVYEILEDDFGFFWLSCRRGIFRISRSNLDDYDAGRVNVLTCTAFGKADGMASVQCNGVAKPAGWKSRDGRLWFPTIRGVVAVEPRIKTNEQPPPVIIEEVLANRRTIWRALDTESTNVTLNVPPGRGEMGFRYTALSLRSPEKNRFKYKLEGVDLDWVDAGTRREAYYNNVAPGTYRLRVIACNNDGVWNETGATLALIFLPHYWQTWWFKLAIAAGAVLLLTALYRSRVARLREIEGLRIEIASNLHDDVGSRLTRVARVTEAMDRQIPPTDRLKPQVGDVFKTTREITQAMDEIVWTINPKNDTLDNLANYIFQYAQEYFQNTGVRCRLDLPAQLPDHPMFTQERHNLFMAVKEALNNVLKHSGATEVLIGLSFANGRLSVVIKDNGRGFAVDTVSRGNGLENMRRRLEKIGGRLTVESQPGQGTTVRMETDRK